MYRLIRSYKYYWYQMIQALMLLNPIRLAQRVAMQRPFGAMTNLNPSPCLLGTWPTTSRLGLLAGVKVKNVVRNLNSVSYNEHLVTWR